MLSKISGETPDNCNRSSCSLARGSKPRAFSFNSLGCRPHLNPSHRPGCECGSTGSFHCASHYQGHSKSCRALPFPHPSPATAAGLNFRGRKSASCGEIVRSYIHGNPLPQRMVPSPAFLVAHTPPLTGGNPQAVAQGVMLLISAAGTGVKISPSAMLPEEISGRTVLSEVP